MKTRVLSLVLAAALTAVLAGCGGSPASSAPVASSTPEVAAPVKVKVGVVGENNEQWVPVIESLKAEGIELELVRFADYSLPNQALADKEIDLNSFQHYAFLENQIKDRGYKLSVIGETIIAPLGVYSKKHTSVDQLKEGASIAIPSDATNGGRALKVLESAGLIEVDPAAGFVPTLSNITKNPLNIKFYEVEAAQTYSLMADVDLAVINGGHARDNGLSPAKDAVYLEKVIEGQNNPYINVIAARTEDQDNELYQKVVKAYRSDAVAKIIAEKYNGAYIITW